MAILVDSSFYIAQQRSRIDFSVVFGPWIRAEQLLTCGIVRAEVLRGLRTSDEYADASDFLDVLVDIPMTPDSWRDTSELAWRLDRKGLVIPLPDVVVAQCALRTNATLITLDDHFRHIPGLKHRKDLPDFA